MRCELHKMDLIGKFPSRCVFRCSNPLDAIAQLDALAWQELGIPNHAGDLAGARALQGMISVCRVCVANNMRDTMVQSIRRGPTDLDKRIAHVLDGKVTPGPVTDRRIASRDSDLVNLQNEYLAAFSWTAAQSACVGAGVSLKAMVAYGAGLRIRCSVTNLTFPVENNDSEIVGVVECNSSGITRLVCSGSGNGMFRPIGSVASDESFLVVDGPLEACAAFDLGFYAIGLTPITSADIVIRLAKRLQLKEAVIVPTFGRDTSEFAVALAESIRVKIVEPCGHSSIRFAISKGVDRLVFDQVIRSANYVVREKRYAERPPKG